MGAPDDVAGKTNSFLELLVDSSCEDTDNPEVDGPTIKLELIEGLLENLKGDSIDCSNELWFEVIADSFDEYEDVVEYCVELCAMLLDGISFDWRRPEEDLMDNVVDSPDDVITELILWEVDNLGSLLEDDSRLDK